MKFLGRRLAESHVSTPIRRGGRGKAGNADYQSKKDRGASGKGDRCEFDSGLLTTSKHTYLKADGRFDPKEGKHVNVYPNLLNLMG